MDYSLLALIGMIVAAMIISTRLHSRSWPGRPGWQYQRVLSVGFFGLLLFVAGLIGWDLRRSGGWFNGAKWGGWPRLVGILSTRVQRMIAAGIWMVGPPSSWSSRDQRISHGSLAPHVVRPSGHR